jgi:hypothetical protein
MHDQNGISGFALSVFLWFSKGAVVNPQLGQCFAGLKFEIANREIAIRRRGIISGGRDTRNDNR